MARKRVSKEEYLKRVNSIHSGCYELVGEFVDMSTKITMKHKCGHEMTTTPSVFLKDKEYCRKCSNRRLSENNSLSLSNLKQITHSFGYELVSDVYINNRKKLNFKCNHGHEFSMIWNAFQNGKRCPSCKFIAQSERQKLPIEEVYKSINDLNYNFIEFPNGYENRDSKVTVECENGHISTKAISSVLIGNGCPYCKKPSKPEVETYNYLNKNNIKFEQQYKFDNCINKRKLPFDFAILNEDCSLKMLIEYDGEQHFKPNDKFGGEEGFARTVENDVIKNEYCKNNNIKLVRITYKQKKKIQEVLENLFGIKGDN